MIFQYIKPVFFLCIDCMKEIKRRLKKYTFQDVERQVILIGAEKKKLNLGCGNKFLGDNFVNIDLERKKGVNMVCNLEYPLPIKDGAVDGILMDNVLEHLESTIGIMNECSRILKTGGLLEIIVPHAKSISAHSDPTHKKFFNEKSFDYFYDKQKQLRKTYGILTRFIKKEFYFSDQMDGYIHIVLEKE